MNDLLTIIETNDAAAILFARIMIHIDHGHLDIARAIAEEAHVDAVRRSVTAGFVLRDYESQCAPLDGDAFPDEAAGRAFEAMIWGQAA